MYGIWHMAYGLCHMPYIMAYMVFFLGTIHGTSNCMAYGIRFFPGQNSWKPQKEGIAWLVWEEGEEERGGGAGMGRNQGGIYSSEVFFLIFLLQHKTFRWLCPPVLKFCWRVKLSDVFVPLFLVFVEWLNFQMSLSSSGFSCCWKIKLSDDFVLLFLVVVDAWNFQMTLSSSVFIFCWRIKISGAFHLRLKCVWSKAPESDIRVRVRFRARDRFDKQKC